jgi:ubiquinone/menaquinone biosynthesis C-methylase UbiE
MPERTSLAYKIGKATAHPGRILPYVRRSARNARLRLASPSHTDFYRAVMADETAKDPDRAIGSDSRDSWMWVGQLQHAYLLQHGLRPEHRLLDIGCGNLRAGWRLMRHLDPGNYYGVDISPDILIAAQDTVFRFDLQDRLPYLTDIGDLKLRFLPTGHFDVVTAHSVFSHTPIEVIDEALAHVGRVLKPSGFFDFTYPETDGAARDFLREDFYYPTRQLLDLTRSHGLTAEKMQDWDYAQAKIRVRRP